MSRSEQGGINQAASRLIKSIVVQHLCDRWRSDARHADVRRIKAPADEDVPQERLDASNHSSRTHYVLRLLHFLRSLWSRLCDYNFCKVSSMWIIVEKKRFIGDDSSYIQQAKGLIQFSAPVGASRMKLPTAPTCTWNFGRPLTDRTSISTHFDLSTTEMQHLR